MTICSSDNYIFIRYYVNNNTIGARQPYTMFLQCGFIPFCCHPPWWNQTCNKAIEILCNRNNIKYKIPCM